MGVSRFQYQPPDFPSGPLRDAPDSTFATPAEGIILPDRFSRTTNLPMDVRVRLRPLPTIWVDRTGFAASKPRDRGTRQAHGMVTNAQEFMHILRSYVEQWEQGHGRARPAARV
jgi:hypothetical protein